MAYRVRGRGHFTAPTTRSGQSFVYTGRRVTVSGDNFQIQWNGPAVIAEMLNGVANAVSKLSDDALRFMQSIVPVDTGDTRDSCFATVEVGEDGRIQLVIGAGTPYTIYIELGTSTHNAQPFIRPTFDYIVRQLPSLLKRESQSRAH